MWVAVFRSWRERNNQQQLQWLIQRNPKPVAPPGDVTEADENESAPVPMNVDHPPAALVPLSEVLRRTEPLRIVSTVLQAPDQVNSARAIKPTRGKFFSYERALLNYVWRTKLDTLLFVYRQTHPEVTQLPSEKDFLPQMMFPPHVCATIAAVLHELRQQREFMCNGPSQADVRDWSSKHADVESWDKPYHPHHYQRRNATPAPIGDEPSFLAMLNEPVSMSCPQDVLRLDDVQYFSTRVHELLAEANQTGCVHLPPVRRIRTQGTHRLWSDRLRRTLKQTFADAANHAWMMLQDPSDATQMKRLVEFQRLINDGAAQSTSHESRLSSINWFGTAVVDVIEDMEQIVDWSRREHKRLQKTEAASVTDARDVSGQHAPISLHQMFHKNDQMVQQCRMTWDFVMRPLFRIVFPYLFRDAHALVLPSQQFHKIMHHVWAPPAGTVELQLPTTLSAANKLQETLHNLKGDDLSHVLEAWLFHLLDSTTAPSMDNAVDAASCTITKIQTQMVAWWKTYGQPKQRQTRAQRLHLCTQLTELVDDWCLMRGAGPATRWRYRLDSTVAKHWLETSALHRVGLRVPLLCGCQPLNSPEDTAPLLCTSETHESYWQWLERITWSLECVAFLNRADQSNAIDSRLSHVGPQARTNGDVLASMWLSAMQHQQLEQPIKRRRTTAKGTPKDELLCAFEQMLEEWFWKETMPPLLRSELLHLCVYGAMFHCDWLEHVTTSLLDVFHTTRKHAPIFRNNLQGALENMFQWTLSCVQISEIRMLTASSSSAAASSRSPITGIAVSQCEPPPVEHTSASSCNINSIREETSLVVVAAATETAGTSEQKNEEPAPLREVAEPPCASRVTPRKREAPTVETSEVMAERLHREAKDILAKEEPFGWFKNTPPFVPPAKK